MKEIPLTQGKTAIVDDADYEIVRGLKWCAHKRLNGFYAVRNIRLQNGKWASVYLHRALLNPPSGMQVDHINGNGLDNRRENLRVVTPAQQHQSFQSKRKYATSTFRGVCYSARLKKWQATLQHAGETFNLGFFDTEVAAARSYNAKATELWGAYANLNTIL